MHSGFRLAKDEDQCAVAVMLLPSGNDLQENTEKDSEEEVRNDFGVTKMGLALRTFDLLRPIAFRSRQRPL